MRSVLAALCLFATAAHAVPAQFTHQGRLLDADGTPLGGDATITFRVTDSETGGTALWEETLTVPLTNGYYSAVLGADDETNPLDTEVLSQAPVWLELQLDGEESMSPRSAINAVPYATMAQVAEEVDGGPVNASHISVAGTPVVNESGEWVGPTTAVNWSDIEGMPADFADGVDDDTDTDTDSFADLGTSCTDGNIPVWDGIIGGWLCGTDQDALNALACGDAQIARWNTDAASWECSDDIDTDTDTQLTEEQVDAMVADNGYLTSSDVVAGSTGTVIYTRCAWTGNTMTAIGECDPPACPSPWDDLGITGNVKGALEAFGSTDYDSSFSESAGTSERACYTANPVTVLHTRCAWTGNTATAIGTCTPPDCPTDWTDLGVTGTVKTGIGMYGSTDYDTSFSESSGYEERTCAR